jgi:hypothetical protein
MDIHVWSTESELAVQNNPTIHNLSTKLELATQYNNPEIYVLSTESELAIQHGKPEIYIWLLN